MHPLSSRLDALPYSGIREMSDLARRTPGALRLELGDPDFTTPAHIVDGGLRRATKERSGYPPTAGIPELRAAIATKLRDRNGIHCGPENVVVTVGATGALYLSMLATLEPGDEVLVPNPGWAGYPAMVALAGGKLRSYRLDPERDFALTVDAVRTALTDATKVVIVNTPNNPTGAVYENSELAGLVELAGQRGIWLISDECYEDIVFEGAHHSLGATGDVDTSAVLSVFSFSKSYAMTGWRIGYVTAASQVASAIMRLQSPAVSSTSIISQWAALEALSGPQEPVAEMAGAYQRRRDMAAALLDDAGVRYILPRGAFYLLVDVRATGGSSNAVARSLLLEAGVSTTPGVAFGDQAEGFLRVSLACADDDLRAGLTRLAEHLQGSETRGSRS